MEARGIARRAVKDLPNFLSLLAFFSATALIFRSIQFALVVTASLGFHELGHAAALAWYGSEWKISFGVVGAWTWSPQQTRERLPQLANAIIHLSGPFFSLILALAALGLQTAWQPLDGHLPRLASFSAQVGFLNLLPLGRLTDGGKIVRRMVASLGGVHRKHIALLPMVVTAVMLFIYGWIESPNLKGPDATSFLLGLLLVGVWMAGSLMIEARRSVRSPDPHSLSRPMTNGEALFLVLVVWDLLAAGLIIIAATPFWLSPEYILGSLRNIEAIVSLLFGLGR